MSEDSLIDEPIVQTDEDGKKKKKPKAKKRPSDFEIVRTILQRTSERKQAYLLKNLGEDPDILLLCSVDEKGFTYGSPDLSIQLIEIIDPDLKIMVDGYINKLYGIKDHPDFSGFIGFRDQISELSKTKGEAFENEIFTNEFGTAWIMRTDSNQEKPKPAYYALAIESLFHVQLVESYVKSFRPLLEGHDPRYLYYPYTQQSNDTASVMTLPPSNQSDHLLAKAYPSGFRALVTKGLDVIMTKGMTGDFPYPVIDEEIITFCETGVACQLVHRVTAAGWRMVMVRPNAVYFPALNTPLPLTGIHTL